MKLEIISIPSPGFSRIPEDFLGMFFPFYRGFYIFSMGFHHVHGGAVRNMGTHRAIGTRHGQGLFTGLLEAKAVGPEWVNTCMGE